MAFKEENIFKFRLKKTIDLLYAVSLSSTARTHLRTNIQGLER